VLAKNNPPKTIEFLTGQVTIREIVFDGDIIGSESVSISHEQVATIDLATGIVTPAVEVVIPFGDYNSVSLGIEIDDVDASPSIMAQGTYTDVNSVVTEVHFEFNSGEVFEAEAESHTFEEGTRAIAQIDFSPAVWFSQVTEAMLDNAVRVNGIIMINESTNEDIFDMVADKLDDVTDATFK
jgi:hypothetical protein